MSGLRDPFRHVRRDARRIRRELEDELAFHLEQRTRELERQGMSPGAARAEALRRFGDVAQTQAVCAAADEQKERRMRRRDLLADLWQDVKFGARQMRRRPGFTVLAVATLGIGIGANTAIFSVADHILLRPLPYADAARVMTVWETDARTGATRMPPSPGDWVDWQERSGSMAVWGLAEPYGFDLTMDVPPEPVSAWLVTQGWFEALGVEPALGRGFTPDDFAAGAQVVLLSHEYWQTRFAGDRSIIGRPISLDHAPATVVGVLPPGVSYPARTGLYAPKNLREEEVRDRRSGYMYAVARLADGVAAEAAGAELAGIAAQLGREHPASNAATGIELVPIEEQVLGPVRPALMTLLGAVGLLLLIACANVAGLLLARDADRAREYAVRAALGAVARRIGRQLFAENAVLTLAASAAGVALAWLALQAFTRFAPAELPRAEFVTLDARVLLFALAAAAVTVVLCGLLPAVHAARARPDDALATRGTMGRGQHRLGRAIVIAEVALALVLLVGAGLLARSFAALISTDIGFATDNRVTLQTFLWDRNPTAEERLARATAIEAALRTTPGVRTVGLTTGAPFHPHRIDAESTLEIGGVAPRQPDAARRITTLVASPDYFRAIGIELVRGRLFTEHDAADAPLVAILNETTVRRYFGGLDPIGRRVSFGVMGAPQEREVVGIVRATRSVRRDAEPEPEVFVPFAQTASGSLTFVVHTESDAAALLPTLEQRIWEVDPQQTVYFAATVEELIGATLADRRFSLWLLGSFSVIALLLAATGLFGLVAFTTERRLPELGIRLALGARPAELTRMVVRDGVIIAAAGVALGVLAAVWLTRLLAGMLYGVTATDPVTYAQVAVLMLAVAALAAWLPARRVVTRDLVRPM